MVSAALSRVSTTLTGCWNTTVESISEVLAPIASSGAPCDSSSSLTQFPPASLPLSTRRLLVSLPRFGWSSRPYRHPTWLQGWNHWLKTRLTTDTSCALKRSARNVGKRKKGLVLLCLRSRSPNNSRNKSTRRSLRSKRRSTALTPTQARLAVISEDKERDHLVTIHDGQQAVLAGKRQQIDTLKDQLRQQRNLR
ncbi:hypothetical protein M427DRAFT_459476 [Gonapodya prolifera JEL478]|uniref:Uncharacterized protein n=1 Tax=Gonapodya prolifera (strain JEL478) TaxID=1344416 RepID=A0A139A284_GONPJ|nr:hypothetical protein M427DRAFT_459476 [Gonapodya prolifera JEL478]|eukprot:KXS10887.1 hypothetical protein M427DRAFT_459476 [Gonapodya prolifera JEL478]